MVGYYHVYTACRFPGGRSQDKFNQKLLDPANVLNSLD